MRSSHTGFPSGRRPARPRDSVPSVQLPPRTETVEDCLLAFGSELEYDTASVGPAGWVVPYRFPFWSKTSPAKGFAHRCIALRTKAVKDRLLAFWSELEYDATSGIA